MRARRRDDTVLALAKTWLVKPVLQESRARARHPPAEASAAISSSTDKKGGTTRTFLRNPRAGARASRDASWETEYS